MVCIGNNPSISGSNMMVNRHIFNQITECIHWRNWILANHDKLFCICYDYLFICFLNYFSNCCWPRWWVESIFREGEHWIVRVKKREKSPSKNENKMYLFFWGFILSENLGVSVKVLTNFIKMFDNQLKFVLNDDISLFAL